MAPARFSLDNNSKIPHSLFFIRNVANCDVFFEWFMILVRFILVSIWCFGWLVTQKSIAEKKNIILHFGSQRNQTGVVQSL